uniref:Ig-like domain-containing protein n=1 Tax=Callorhinchus milii TaxID=7868 RepID=A0A4W3GPU9_CALMI
NKLLDLIPVLTALGNDVTLGCWLTPGVAADMMDVEWSKSDSGVVVHLYTRGVDRPYQQHEAYRGGTELIRDGMNRGNVSLRLKNVSCSDQGEYTCSVRSTTDFGETTVVVKVEGLRLPLISMAGYQDSRLKLTCKSKGWYSKPRVVWFDRSGAKVKSPYITVTPVKALRLHKNVIRFYIKWKNDRIIITYDTKFLYVTEVFFHRGPDWMVVFLVTFSLVLGAAGVLVFFCRKRLKKVKGNK